MFFFYAILIYLVFRRHIKNISTVSSDNSEEISKPDLKISQSRISLNIDNQAKNVIFSIKNEEDRDKLAKKRGYTVENQVELASFDDKFYLVSDDKIINDFLKESRILQEKILEISEIGKDFGFNFSYLKFKKRKIYLYLDHPDKISLEQLEKLKNDKIFSDKIIASLQQISDIIKNEESLANKLLSSNDLTTSIFNRILFILNIATIILLTSFFQPDLVSSDSFAIVFVDKLQLIYDSLKISLLIGFFMIAFAIKKFLKTSKFHLVITKIYIFALLGSCMTSYLFIKNININHDDSLPLKSEKIIERKWSDSSIFGKKYYLDIKDVQNDNITQIEVKKLFYKNINQAETVELEEKQGFLSYKWLKIIKKQ